MTRKSTIWLSYDLGVRGDYESFYAWLDSHGAEECVESLAVLTYGYSGSLVDRLRAEIGEAIEISKRTRIYLIYRDPVTKKNKGVFLFGGRRAAPWTGFAHNGSNQADDEV